MDQYNYNPQGSNAQREPVPTFSGPTQYDYPPQPPVYEQISSENVPEIQPMIEEAFTKCLTGMIMSFFPFLCFFAFFISNKGLNLLKQANDLATQYGVKAGGKATTSKIFGTIGKIYSILNGV